MFSLPDFLIAVCNVFERRAHNDMSSHTWDRSGDPLVYFLKEMRAEDLLDAQSEIRLAKAIARGKNHLISVVFSIPFCLDTLNQIGEKLKSGEFRVSELVHVNDIEDSGENEERSHQQENVNAQFQTYVEQFKVLAEISQRYTALHFRGVALRKTKSSTLPTKKALDRLHRSLVKQIHSLKLQHWVIERVIHDFRESVSHEATNEGASSPETLKEIDRVLEGIAVAKN